MEEENGKEADGSGLSESSEHNSLRDLGLRTHRRLSEYYLGPHRNSQSLSDDTQKTVVSHSLPGHTPHLPPPRTPEYRLLFSKPPTGIKKR